MLKTLVRMHLTRVLRHFDIKSFYVTLTVCTVDFEMPNFFAAHLTVALLSIIKCARDTTLSEM